MKQEKVGLEVLTLIGISIRTNNKDEMNSAAAKIGAVAELYWTNQL